MTNNGKDAEDAFYKHWQAVGHVERLRDKKDLMGLNKGLRLADFAKPSDFLVSSRLTPLHYAEVKSTLHLTTFYFKDIRPAQTAAALKENRRGNGSYFFYIYSYANAQWYIMSANDYENILSEGRKSVRFEELAKWNAIK